MNREAIYSDETSEYISPMEPEIGQEITIRIRLEHTKEPAHVDLIKVNNQPHPMERIMQRGRFDIYQAKIQLDERVFPYYFSIESEGDKCFYDKFGTCDFLRPQYVFRVIPGFATPNWAKGAIMYQILVDRFYNADESNDVKDREYYYISVYSTKVKDWYADPNPDFGVGEFYGGDLDGVAAKLDYLASLGVEVIYFNPLFVSPSNHKYDIADYDHIDPHYGRIVKDEGDVLCEGDTDNLHATNFICRATDQANLDASDAAFAEFVEQAHKRGMRVILDGVFNHSGSFNKWLNREGIYSPDRGYAPGAYETEDSPYHNYYRFFDEDQWPNNSTYEGWWGHDTLPKLNYEESKELYNYILHIAKKWVSPPYNADGWRLDVAADLGHSPEANHKFWRDFRSAVKEANSNAIILAEHYGDATSWLSGGEWDTVMNYDAFMEPVSYFVTGMEKHSDSKDESAKGDVERFENTMLHFMARFTGPSLYCSMNQLSNHDHSRFLTRTNGKVGRARDLGVAAASQDISIPLFKLGVLIQMTWPGAPTLYYGDEAGVCGFTDPDNRRTFPWERENRQLIDYYRDAILLHKGSSALRSGSFKFLARGKNTTCYARFDVTERYIIAINIGDEPVDMAIPVYLAEVEGNFITRVFITNERGYSLMQKCREVQNGILSVTLPPQTGAVYCEEAQEVL